MPYQIRSNDRRLSKRTWMWLLVALVVAVVVGFQFYLQSRSGVQAVAWGTALPVTRTASPTPEPPPTATGAPTQPPPAASPIPVSSPTPLATAALDSPALTAQAGDLESGAVTVFFSNPLAGLTAGGPETPLIAAIQGAQRSIDIAMFSLNQPAVIDALAEAYQRGVQVRVVLEKDNSENKAILRFQQAGGPIVSDQRKALMNNKFIIIDEQEVWTGSLNLTSASAYRDYNNLVRLQSRRAAQIYTAEFNEMFVEGLFGAGSSSPPNPLFQVGSIPAEVYFSPDDGVQARLIAEIERATRSIDLLAHAFTSQPVAEAIRARAAAGVSVRAVFDGRQVQTSPESVYAGFQQAGFDVRLDGVEGLLHDKILIIDGLTVITGSYNFIPAAELNNDENLLILRDPTLAGLFLQHFEQVYAEGK